MRTVLSHGFVDLNIVMIDDIDRYYDTIQCWERVEKTDFLFSFHFVDANHILLPVWMTRHLQLHVMCYHSKFLFKYIYWKKWILIQKTKSGEYIINWQLFTLVFGNINKKRALKNSQFTHFMFMYLQITFSIQT
jgi:hypothetical protein